MSARLRLLAASSILAASAASSGCGSGSPSTQAAAPRDEASFGHTGGRHALGADPKAEMSRLKKAAAAASAPQPGRLPGR